jgi:hypothetical protein
VCEDLTGSGTFPHVYAAIPIAAVVAVYEMRKERHGKWSLPKTIDICFTVKKGTSSMMSMFLGTVDA